MMPVQPTSEPPLEMEMLYQHPPPWGSGTFGKQGGGTQNGSVTVSERSSHLIDGVGVR